MLPVDRESFHINIKKYRTTALLFLNFKKINIGTLTERAVVEILLSGRHFAPFFNQTK